MKAMAAFVALVIGFASAQAEACNVNRISGVYDVTVTQTRFERWDPHWTHIGFSRGTAHTTCSFHVRRLDNRRTHLNIQCNQGWAPNIDPTFGTFPKPFAQSGVDTGSAHLFPWHRFHRQRGCRWRIVDLNDVDAEYRVSFSQDGQSLTGQGSGATISNEDTRGEILFINTFNGVKVRR